VPTYNWTRRGAPLPRSARAESYNRVLIISHVSVEDQGEYICRAANDRAAIENSVTLTIQAEPNFTIPLTDKHMDLGSDLSWTCEAFGLPDVNYTWFRNGELLNPMRLPDDYRDRYDILWCMQYQKDYLKYSWICTIHSSTDMSYLQNQFPNRKLG